MNRSKKIFWGVVAAVAAVILISATFTVVPTGYTGVRVTFGQVSDKVVSNGINFTVPFVQDIKLINNKQQDIMDYSRIWSETSERTAIYYEGVTVTYQINPAFSSWIYANVSDYQNNLITSALVASAVKASSKTLTDTEATNRGLTEPLIQANLQKSLDEKYRENTIIINKVTVSNIDFDDSYNLAIAEKQKAQIEAEQQAIENKRAIEKAEADAKVTKTKAQAEADAALIAANAEAQVNLIKAEAEAEANKLVQDSLTEVILRKEYLEKWNGELPQVLGSDGTDLLLDLTGKESK